jgi:hypothetical protein
VAWSEHAFEIACFAGSVGFAAGADCPATGFVVGVVCAIVALDPNRTTNADSIKVFKNVIVTCSNRRLHGINAPAGLGHLHTIVATRNLMPPRTTRRSDPIK